MKSLVAQFENLCEALPDAVASRCHADIGAIHDALSQYVLGEPDAWLVRATRDGKANCVAFRRKQDAEQDAYEWRINGATTEVLPLFISPQR